MDTYCISHNLSRFRVWVFCAICFVLPTKASFIYCLTALLLIVWIAEGKLVEKLRNLFSSRICLACYAYSFVYLLAMLWTEDVNTGWHMVGRQISFLLFPLYLSSAEHEYKECYISAFIAGLCMCALLAHYNFMQLHWFPEWPRGVRVYKSIGDTAPFVDWLMYAPMLAFGTYLSLRRAIFATKTSERITSVLITSLLLSNLLFSGGRAGMVMFIALFVTLIFEGIIARRKALLVCLVLVPLSFCLAYHTVDLFAERVDKGITDIRIFDKNPNTSAGLRFVFWSTSFRLFLQNPFLGVGSGDFQAEYAKAKPAYWEMTPDTPNPHNQFLLTGVTTGLLGLIALFYIFYSAAVGADIRTKSMLIGFAVVCMFESYLWRSNTSLTFLVMLAALTTGKDATRKL